ncbi:MAG: hypothetical protein JWO13_92 [Acidobacteriales bacterium]|nr:hypothetical protein [Terriglobales bacterium]
MVFGISDNGDAPADFLDDVTLGNGINSVVSSLGMEVGAKLANQSADIRLGENNDGINVGEGGHDFGAFGLRSSRASFTFECANGAVSINGDDELAAEFFGPTEVADVSDVKEVEASVGKRDGLARCAPFGDTLAERFAILDLVFRISQSEWFSVLTRKAEISSCQS